MTNGEKLCIDFPNMRYSISEHRVITTIGVAASFDLDWWNAEYKEPTTKNDLGVDCISRKEVKRIINKWLSHPDYELKDHIYSMTEKIHSLPSITPQEPILDKIRAEIASLSNANPSYWHSGDMVEREEVLNIIEKYRAESEDKECI